MTLVDRTLATYEKKDATKTFSAGVDLDRLSIVVEALVRNYSHPLEAVIREWASNAVDASPNSAVKVFVPSKENPVLTVVDDGSGMSVSDIEDVYTSFGGTIKEDDNTSVGRYGIGAKSALAVADEFVVATVQDGLENVYRMYRSSAGDIAVDSIIYNAETTKPNGTTVSVRVEDSHIDGEEPYRAARVLAGWSTAEVEMYDGEGKILNFYTGDKRTFKNHLLQRVPDISIETESGFIYKNLFESNPYPNYENIFGRQDRNNGFFLPVIVGGVLYQVSLPKISGFMGSNSSWIPVVGAVKLPPNAVTFPSGREVIEETSENLKTIAEAYGRLLQEAADIVTVKSTGISSFEEAVELSKTDIYSLLEKCGGLGVTVPSIVYKDAVVSSHLSPENTDTGMQAFSLDLPYGRGTEESLREMRFELSKTYSVALDRVAVVIETGEQYSMAKTRKVVRQWLFSENKKVGDFLASGLKVRKLEVVVVPKANAFLHWLAKDRQGVVNVESMDRSARFQPKKHSATRNNETTAYFAGEALKEAGSGTFEELVEKFAKDRTIVLARQAFNFSSNRCVRALLKLLGEKERDAVVLFAITNNRQVSTFQKAFPENTIVEYKDWVKQPELRAKILDLATEWCDEQGEPVGMRSTLADLSLAAASWGEELPAPITKKMCEFLRIAEVGETLQKALKNYTDDDAVRLDDEISDLLQGIPDRFAFFASVSTFLLKRVSSSRVEKEEDRNYLAYQQAIDYLQKVL